MASFRPAYRSCTAACHAPKCFNVCPFFSLPTGRCSRLKASFDLGVGELAGTLLRVCKYALSALDVHDIIFGGSQLGCCRAVAGLLEPACRLTDVCPSSWHAPLLRLRCAHAWQLAGIYSLAQHHMETRAEDAVRGTPVRNPVMLTWLLYCCNLAMAAYCPTEQEFAAAANCKVGQPRGWLGEVMWPASGWSPAVCIQSTGCRQGARCSMLRLVSWHTRVGHRQLCPSMLCKAEDIVELQADSDSTRPAYAIGVDHKARQVGGRMGLASLLAGLLAGVGGQGRRQFSKGVPVCARLAALPGAHGSGTA